jgi:hypothetical protein
MLHRADLFVTARLTSNQRVSSNDGASTVGLV